MMMSIGKSTIRSLAGLATVVAVFFVGPVVHAADEPIDRRISYQGKLAGTVGAVTLVLRIFQDGLPIWGPEEQLVNPDADGRFIAIIGETELDLCARQGDGSLDCAAGADTVPDLDQIEARDLELEVGIRESGGTLTVLAPRQRLFPSFHAASAETVVDASITEVKIADSAVTESKLADGAVTAAKLAPGAVGQSAIASNAITGAQIQNGSITGADIAVSGVTGSNVQNFSISAIDLANGAVTSSKIAINSISSSHIVNDSIDVSDLATSVMQNVPPNSSGVNSVILATGNGCPTFNGVQIYTNLGNYILTRATGGTGTFTLCRQ